MTLSSEEQPSALKRINQAASENLTASSSFKEGNQFEKIDAPGVEDKVSLTDGDTISGKITSVTSDEIKMTQNDGTDRVLRVNQVAGISSPRVFEFTITATDIAGKSGDTGVVADGEKITFRPTYKITKPVNSSKVGKSGKKPIPTATKLAVGVVAALLIATAIAVPIAVAVGRRDRKNPPVFVPIQPEAPPEPSPPLEIP